MSKAALKGLSNVFISMHYPALPLASDITYNDKMRIFSPYSRKKIVKLATLEKDFYLPTFSSAEVLMSS